MTRLPMLALVVCLGCNAADALAPAGATRVELGPRFESAWRAVEECSGLSGDPNSVAVYSVPGESITLNGRAVVAYWRDGRIFIAQFYLSSDPVLRHEVLHALLQTGEHPAEYFVTRCGSVVGT